MIINKKGNIIIVITIVAILLITTGVFSWFFIEKIQTPVAQKKLDQTVTASQPIIREDNNQSEKFLYKDNNNLALYEPYMGEKKIILSSSDIIDYDLSRDGKLIAYSLREDGFSGNSDIYLKYIDSGVVIRLTEKNNIASLNPKIFPDNNKIAYVRRTLNEKTNKLSDGEIWVIDSNGDINSSKKLIGDDSKSFIEESKLDKVKDDNGNWTGEYFCIDKNEIDDVKIGINEISSDSKKIEYWKSYWGLECSGIWRWPYFSNIDGTDFFSEKFEKQNIFEMKLIDKLEKYDWKVSKTFWLDNGDFIVNNATLPPLVEESVYYFDKNQNKKWTIFDSVEKKSNSSFSQISILDAKELSENKILMAYQLYFNQSDSEYFSDGKFAGNKYFIKELTIGENIDAEQLLFGTPLFTSEMALNSPNISNIKIINKDFVMYKKENADKSIALYAYNLRTNEEKKVDNIN